MLELLYIDSRIKTKNINTSKIEDVSDDRLMIY